MDTTPIHPAAEGVDRAFRAAYLLTGNVRLAEAAVLNGIASLETNDNVEKALVAKTIEFLVRPGLDSQSRIDRALALLPHELQRLILIAPLSRACFLLRILFGSSPANCAKALNLTMAEFDVSLRVAMEQLSSPGDLNRSGSPIHLYQTEGAH